MSTPPVALTIAASDPLGGAGLQADLTTFATHGVHGASALTAVTAQTATAVLRVEAVDPDLVAAQIDGILAVFRIAAVKTGLLPSPAVVSLIADRVEAEELPAPIVDPVLVDGRGRRFLDTAVEVAYRERLFPLARVLTPNGAEASLLLAIPLKTVAQVTAHADRIRALGAELTVVTGGGMDGDPHDVCVAARTVWSSGHKRVATDNVRGSGCTFAAALTARVAHGDELGVAITRAGEFVHGAITEAEAWSFGPGGPVSHLERHPTS